MVRVLQCGVWCSFKFIWVRNLNPQIAQRNWPSSWSFACIRKLSGLSKDFGCPQKHLKCWIRSWVFNPLNALIIVLYVTPGGGPVDRSDISIFASNLANWPLTPCAVQFLTDSWVQTANSASSIRMLLTIPKRCDVSSIRIQLAGKNNITAGLGSERCRRSSQRENSCLLSSGILMVMMPALMLALCGPC